MVSALITAVTDELMTMRWWVPAPSMARLAMPGPVMLTLSVRAGRSAPRVIVPVTVKMIVSTDPALALAAAIASRSVHSLELQIPSPGSRRLLTV